MMSSFSHLNCCSRRVLCTESLAHDCPRTLSRGNILQLCVICKGSQLQGMNNRSTVALSVFVQQRYIHRNTRTCIDYGHRLYLWLCFVNYLYIWLKVSSFNTGIGNFLPHLVEDMTPAIIWSFVPPLSVSICFFLS